MSCRFEEGGYHWFRTDKRCKIVAFSVRKEDSNELALICPCADTINKLLPKNEKRNNYYLGRIWRCP